MPWYYRVRVAINAAAPFLAPTQSDQPRPAGERHPKEEDPLPLGVGPSIPYS